jgi:hypothetical protein
MNTTDEIRARIFARNPHLRAAWEEEQQQELGALTALRRKFHALTETLDPWELRDLARWLDTWKR